MSIWYVSSVAHAAIPQWTAGHAYNVGDFVRRLAAPADYQQHVWRCTVAGTSSGAEPAWAGLTTFGSTTVDNTVTWTLVSGHPSYGWNAAAGSLQTLDGISMTRPFVSGDIVAVSSDHVNPTGTTSFRGSTEGGATTCFVSVNRAGSVPPVEADYQRGAKISQAATITIGWSNASAVAYFGFDFEASTFQFASSQANDAFYLFDCSIYITGAASASRINSGIACRIIWDKVTVRFSHVSQGIAFNPGTYFEWRNTATPLHALSTQPAALFLAPVWSAFMSGIDFSALTGSVVGAIEGKFVLRDCIKPTTGRLYAAGLAEFQSPDSRVGAVVELFDGIASERWTGMGRLVPTMAFTLDGIAFAQPFAHQMTTYPQTPDLYAQPFESFPLLLPVEATGGALTFAIDILWENNPGLFREYGIALASAATVVTFSNSNKTIANTGTSNNTLALTQPYLTSGKYYIEVTCNTIVSANSNMGIGLVAPLYVSSGSGAFKGVGGAGLSAVGTLQGTRRNVVKTAPASTVGLGTWVTGDVICFAVDFDNSLLWARRNAASWNNNGAADPATGVGGYDFSGAQEKEGPQRGLCFAADLYTVGQQLTVNAGDSAFAHAAPSGFSAWQDAAHVLDNSEVWLELDYQPNAGNPLGGRTSGILATPMSARVGLSASLAAWAGGLAGGVPLRMTKTVVPGRDGVAAARVCIGRPGTRIYVDPQLKLVA